MIRMTKRHEHITVVCTCICMLNVGLFLCLFFSSNCLHKLSKAVNCCSLLSEISDSELALIVFGYKYDDRLQYKRKVNQD